jgi:rare lipoprotein A (peptidoglycan hydrolase)
MTTLSDLRIRRAAAALAGIAIASPVAVAAAQTQGKQDAGHRHYRRATASWYGPGFYGHRTACGRTLTPSTPGVANKHLPCGAKVTLHYRGQTATVPVIDRGPYVAGREFDLTARTKRSLHFGSTGTVRYKVH